MTFLSKVDVRIHRASHMTTLLIWIKSHCRHGARSSRGPVTAHKRRSTAGEKSSINIMLEIWLQAPFVFVWEWRRVQKSSSNFLTPCKKKFFHFLILTSKKSTRANPNIWKRWFSALSNARWLSNRISRTWVWAMLVDFLVFVCYASDYQGTRIKHLERKNGLDLVRCSLSLGKLQW